MKRVIWVLLDNRVTLVKGEYKVNKVSEVVMVKWETLVFKV